jgi:hypothetical protein
MLSRKTYNSLGVQALVAIGLLSGCVITETTTTGTTGAGGSPSTTSVGTGGEGGRGGAGVGGGTTSTSSTSSSSTSSSTTTTSSTTTSSTSSTGTGGGMCVGETGTGVVDDCDDLNITPPSHGGGASAICGPNFDQEPPGYGLCTHGFAIFNTGAATTLVKCLATIGVQDSCKEAPLVACIDKMYDSACEIPAIKDACADIKASCVASPFDDVQCAEDLNPLSEAGVMKFGDCMNSADMMLTCQQAYDLCHTEVLNP